MRNMGNRTRDGLDMSMKRRSEKRNWINNAIRTKYVKLKTISTQKNSNCKLCCDKDEMVNHTRSECRKLKPKEYKTCLDEKDFLHRIVQETKILPCWQTRIYLYMHKQESVQEKETHKILWNLEIQTDHLIPTRRSDLVSINKKKKN